MCCVFFFFNDTATTEIYTLSLHDALPICRMTAVEKKLISVADVVITAAQRRKDPTLAIPVRSLSNVTRSEEHTSELQSRLHLVCRLLLEKKKKQRITTSGRERDRQQTVPC